MILINTDAKKLSGEIIRKKRWRAVRFITKEAHLWFKVVNLLLLFAYNQKRPKYVVEWTIRKWQECAQGFIVNTTKLRFVGPKVDDNIQRTWRIHPLLIKFPNHAVRFLTRRKRLNYLQQLKPDIISLWSKHLLKVKLDPSPTPARKPYCSWAIMNRYKC